MPAPSHSYAFSASDLARALGPPAGGILAIALLLHAAARLEVLPPPVPADFDRTLLVEKARLATEAGAASLVLLGDSSCLMNVDAVELGRLLAEPTLNLATLSYLDLAAHGELLDQFVRAHPAAPARVVLLLHPEALWRGEAAPGYVEFLRAQFAGNTASRTATVRPGWETWLAADVLRERAVQPWIPAPLRGEFAVEYGTTFEAVRRLRSGRGSLVDPSRFQPDKAGTYAEYRLGKRIEEASRAFRRRLPVGSRLIIGLTPVPASLAAADHEARAREMLVTWSAWIGADESLTRLPPTLPDNQFATHTHLNARGRADYTQRLAASLRVTQPVE